MTRRGCVARSNTFVALTVVTLPAMIGALRLRAASTSTTR